jgi:cytosine/adenosine deaminase-related metal-dependent hydrolase
MTMMGVDDGLERARQQQRNIRKRCVLAATILVSACSGNADQFVRPMAGVVALAHVRVIDGTGRPGRDDQTVLVEHGRISSVGDGAAVTIPPGASTLNLQGRTVIPGLLGMHNHLFYQLEPAGSTSVVLAQGTFAKLYLASGVTTIRTAGTADFSADARIKREIDTGREPGPKIHLSGEYLVARTTAPDPDGVAKQVARDADRGATSFKAYTTLRGSELKAAIAAAHDRGLAITGHLCAVGFREAAALGRPLQAARDSRKDRTTAGHAWWSGVLRHEMAFERAFVGAGGRLLAGADPTGWGAVVAGYGDQRGLELLVAAGLSPEEAIRIATSNGAAFLKDPTVGTIAAGLQADLVVVRGDPSQRISDVRNVELVFKDGVAYDPETLVAAAAGTLGAFTVRSLLTWPVIVSAIIVLGLFAARQAARRPQYQTRIHA